MTVQVDNINSICSTFVICSPRHFTCAACHLGKTVDFSSIQSLLSPPESNSLNSQTTIVSSVAMSNDQVDRMGKMQPESDDSSKISSNESPKESTKMSSDESLKDSSKMGSSESSKETINENKGNDNEVVSDHPDSSSSDSSDSSMEKAKKKIEPLTIKNDSFRVMPSLLSLICLLLLIIVL
jgi:hypothetical protein